MCKVQNSPNSSKKFRYKVTNWKDYNEALIARGKLTFWFDDKVITNWYHHQETSQVGTSKTYSDDAILLLLTLKAVYHLGFRQTQGLAESIFRLQGLPLKVPNYTVIQRRAAKLDVKPLLSKTATRPIIADSTGLKVQGEGEWKVKKHGKEQPRRWLKLHLFIDAQTQEIVVEQLGSNEIYDGHACMEMINTLTAQGQQMSHFYGDGAYDYLRIWSYCGERIPCYVPPCANAVETDISAYVQRNQVVKQKDETGFKTWKASSGYHERSKVETAMYRFKHTFGERVYSRGITHQKVEVQVKIRILNKMIIHGKPNTVRII